MIASTILGPLSFLLIGTERALAYNGPLNPKFTLPPSVKADTEFTVGVKNNLTNTDGWTVYNVYLAFNVPGVKYPVTACSLATKVKIDTTEIKAKIPADVAPDSTKMFVEEIMFVNSPYENLTSPELQSAQSFSFQGGKGEFATFELDGGRVGYADLIPCSAYKCARDCGIENRKDMDKYEPKKEYECFATCPGTDFPSWDDYAKQAMGQDVDSTSSSTASATSSGVSTATSSSGLTSETSDSETDSTPSAPESKTTDSSSDHLQAKTMSLLLAGLGSSFVLFY